MVDLPKFKAFHLEAMTLLKLKNVNIESMNLNLGKRIYDVDVPFENGEFSSNIGSMVNVNRNTIQCDEGMKKF